MPELGCQAAVATGLLIPGIHPDSLQKNPWSAGKSCNPDEAAVFDQCRVMLWCAEFLSPDIILTNRRQSLAETPVVISGNPPYRYC